MDRYKIIRYFAYTIEILILYMVQETPGLLPAGIAFGLLCGLFLDIGMGGVLGFHGLLLAAACYGVGLLTADLIQTNFLTSLLLAAGAVAGILFLQWVFFYLLYGYEYSGYALVTRYLPRMAYSFCTMPLCYAFNRALAQQIRSKTE